MKESLKKEIKEWLEIVFTFLCFAAIWIAIYMFMWTSDKHYPG